MTDGSTTTTTTVTENSWNNATKKSDGQTETTTTTTKLPNGDTTTTKTEKKTDADGNSTTTTTTTHTPPGTPPGNPQDSLPGGGGGNGWPPPPPPARARDPLVVDLDGNGVALVALKNSTAYYDFDGTGFATKTGWINASDGFLVVDKGSAGISLLGNADEDGFVALSHLDGNADGRVDSTDAQFADLKVWRDANSDGAADVGELLSLADAGISAINLDAATSTIVDQGTRIGYRGTYVRTDGSTALAETLYFQTDSTFTKWVAPSGFQISNDALQLPALQGYGLIANLQAAMTLDPSLLAAVKTLVLASAGMSSAELRDAFEAVLFKWAGVDGVASDAHGPNFDGRRIEFMEKFYGQTLAEMNGTPEAETPNAHYAAILRGTYDALVSGLLTRFMAQAPVSALAVSGDIAGFASNPYLPLVYLGYSAATDGFTGSLSTAITKIIAQAPASKSDAIAYYDKVGQAVSGVAGSYFGGDQTAFASALRTGFAAIGDAALIDFIVARATDLLGTSSATSAVMGGGSIDLHLLGTGVAQAGAGDSNDVYLFSVAAADNVTIEDSGSGPWSPSAADRLDLAGLNPADIALSRDGASEMLRLFRSFDEGGRARRRASPPPYGALRKKDWSSYAQVVC